MKTTTRLGIIHKVDLYKRIINKYRIRDYLLCKKANSGTITVGSGTQSKRIVDFCLVRLPIINTAVEVQKLQTQQII